MSFPNEEHSGAAQSAAKYWKAKVGVYVWPSVTLAQAVIESANWTRLTGKNNGFGIKATPAQRAAGEATLCWTREVVNGVSVRVQQWFANYDSLSDAYIAHDKLLATSHYYEASRHDNNPRQYVVDISKHYATDPRYKQVILHTMDVLDLYRYDVPDESAPRIPTKTLQPPVELQRATRAPAASAGAVIAAGVGAAISHGSGWNHDILAAAMIVGGIAAALAVYRLVQAHATLAAIVAPLPPGLPPITPLPTASSK